MRACMPKSGVFVALAAILVVNISVAEELDHKSIAAGSAQWVSSRGDESSTDAMVDIGAIHQIGDALEAIIRWPYLPSSYGPEVVEKRPRFAGGAFPVPECLRSGNSARGG